MRHVIKLLFSFFDTSIYKIGTEDTQMILMGKSCRLCINLCYCNMVPRNAVRIALINYCLIVFRFVFRSHEPIYSGYNSYYRVPDCASDPFAHSAKEERMLNIFHITLIKRTIDMHLYKVYSILS